MTDFEKPVVTEDVTEAAEPPTPAVEKQKCSAKQLENLAKARATRAAKVKKVNQERKEREAAENKEYLQSEIDKLVEEKLLAKLAAKKPTVKKVVKPRAKPKSSVQKTQNDSRGERATAPFQAENDDYSDDASETDMPQFAPIQPIYDPWAGINH